MGCGPSKELKTNLTTDDPNQIVGSTMLQADKIIVLGDSVFLPTKSPDGESAILEVSISYKISTFIEDIEINSCEVVSLKLAGLSELVCVPCATELRSKSEHLHSLGSFLGLVSPHTTTLGLR
ncbi:unnamed protein product [Phytophthora lilii]|uniref:Unnamed protein product n=1 Tax=Phytophthora lilii TaxID=2077276 RepID=A0A9W6TZW9_9STRA|nr:unnamed protein product [Phytophthora lilii]